MNNDRNRVCPVELSHSLESKVRRWLQNPYKIVSPYVKEGATALDVGCGPGFFTIEMAKLVGKSGKVIAADLQQGMLDKLKAKIIKTELFGRIALVKCDTDNINVDQPVDFILTFYMVHEVPDKNALFKQLHRVLNEHGTYLLVEPKLFHVSAKEFQATLRIAQDSGFEIHTGPKLPLSWSALLHKKSQQATA
jgi:ubiquinone/menaquinone biosynthesis C-methylase UbiE